MTQYYYLVASLPVLFIDGPLPFTSAAFLDRCREQVSATDHALLARISFTALDRRHGDHSAWLAYSSWETALRNEVAVQRGHRLGLDPAPFLREAPFFTEMHTVVKEALGAGTPRAVEAALDRRRWSFLDELEAGTQFDLGRLVAYRLKLLLLERRSRFQPEAGRESFRREYARMTESAAAWAGAPGVAGAPGHTENLNV